MNLTKRNDLGDRKKGTDHISWRDQEKGVRCEESPKTLGVTSAEKGKSSGIRARKRKRNRLDGLGRGKESRLPIRGKKKISGGEKSACLFTEKKKGEPRRGGKRGGVFCCRKEKGGRRVSKEKRGVTTFERALPILLGERHGILFKLKGRKKEEAMLFVEGEDSTC